MAPIPPNSRLHGKVRLRGLSLLVVASLFGASGCADPSPKPPFVDVQAEEELLCGVSPDTQGLQDFVATNTGSLTYEPYILWGIKQGCFAAHGLNVMNTQTKGSAASKLAALVGGSADVAADGVLEVVLSSHAFPGGIRIVSAHNEYSAGSLRLARQTELVDGNLILQTALVVSPEIGFGALDRLAGSRIAIGSKTNNTSIGLLQAFVASGVDPGSIEFVELDNSERLTALLRGDVDAATLTGADVRKALDSGYRIGVYPTAYLYGPGAVTFWYTTEERWNADSQSLISFRTGLWQTFDLLNDPDNLDDFKRFLVEDYGLSTEVVEDLEMHSLAARPASFSELRFYIPFMVREELIPPGYRLPADLIIE